MPQTKNAQAIVVRAYHSGEADTILRLITPEYGKISAIAKYAKKSRKRYGTSFDVLDCGVFELREGRSALSSVTGYVENLSFRNIRNDLSKLCAAATLCEVCDHLLPEHSGPEELSYKVITETLAAIDSNVMPKEILKSLFNGLYSLLVISGFIDQRSEILPSAKNLLALLHKTEEITTRELNTKTEICRLIKNLRN